MISLVWFDLFQFYHEMSFIMLTSQFELDEVKLARYLVLLIIVRRKRYHIIKVFPLTLVIREIN
jgi:hypothetical protein